MRQGPPRGPRRPRKDSRRGGQEKSSRPESGKPRDRHAGTGGPGAPGGKRTAPRTEARRPVPRPPEPTRVPRTKAHRPLAEPPEQFSGEAEIVWGRHAVLEALKGDRPVNKVWLLRGLEDQALAGHVRRLAREKGAVIQEVERGKLNDLVPGSHQGLVASLAPVAYIDFDDLIATAARADRPLILVLDGIEDPHNLGALIRTAGAAGAQGVVIPRRRAAGLTGTVAKAAAGALEHVPVARVNSLPQALEALKRAGFWVVGADQDAADLAYEADLDRPVAALVGAEGAGLSRLVAEKCDVRVCFPMSGAVPSLNASVAGGLLLFEVVRQQREGE